MYAWNRIVVGGVWYNFTLGIGIFRYFLLFIDAAIKSTLMFMVIPRIRLVYVMPNEYCGQFACMTLRQFSSG